MGSTLFQRLFQVGGTFKGVLVGHQDALDPIFQFLGHSFTVLVYFVAFTIFLLPQTGHNLGDFPLVHLEGDDLLLFLSALLFLLDDDLQNVDLPVKCANLAFEDSDFVVVFQNGVEVVHQLVLVLEFFPQIGKINIEILVYLSFSLGIGLFLKGRQIVEP